jgi:hypothetical protein
MFNSSLFKIVSFIVAGLIFQLAVGYRLERITDYQKIFWKQSDSCQILDKPEISNLKGRSAFINSTFASCETTPFKLASSTFEIELAGNSSLSTLHLIVLNENGDQLPSKVEGKAFEKGKWNSAQVSLPKTTINKTVTIAVSLSEGANQRDSELFVRSHMYFVESSSFLKITSKYFDNIFVKIFSSLLLAVAIYWLVFTTLCNSNSNIKTFTLLFVLSLVIHFRLDAFFYWDEWHVLSRFAEQGIAGTLHAHNEHYVPLFFLVYYFEALLFKANYSYYLIFSLAFHALNCLLLIKILTRLTGSDKNAEFAAGLLGVFYLLGATHAEVLHWAFTFAIVLSQTFIFSSILLMDRFIRTGKLRILVYICLTACGAALSFGNGFLVIPLLALLGIFYASFPNTSSLWREILPPLIKRIKRVAFCLISAIAGLVFVATIYLSIKTKGGHQVDLRQSLSQINLIIDYIFVGTWLGTVLRGLGFWPVLSLQAHEELLSGLIKFMRPAMFLSWAGVGVSLVLLLTSFFSRERKRFISLWLIGHLVIIGSFVLPALARWQFGAHQALAFRYQYPSQFGLVILLVPFVIFLLNNKKIVYSKYILPPLLIGAFFVQLLLGNTFTHSVNVGRDNILFADKLLLWAKENKKIGRDITNSFESTDTELSGLYPIVPSFLTPGLHPLIIYKTLLWLEGN